MGWFRRCWFGWLGEVGVDRVIVRLCVVSLCVGSIGIGLCVFGSVIWGDWGGI